MLAYYLDDRLFLSFAARLLIREHSEEPLGLIDHIELLYAVDVLRLDSMRLSNKCTHRLLSELFGAEVGRLKEVVGHLQSEHVD